MLTPATGPLTTTIDAMNGAAPVGGDGSAGPAGGATGPADSAVEAGGGPGLADASVPSSQSQAVVDGAASAAAPATADGAAAFMSETPGVGALPGMPGSTQGAPGADGPAFPAPGVADATLPADPPAMDLTTLPQPRDGSALATFADYAPDARVLVSAAVVAIAGASIIGAQGSGGGGTAQIAFTNVRLLPCIVKASFERQLEVLTHLVARGGGAPAQALHGGPGFGSDSSAATGRRGHPGTPAPTRLAQGMQGLLDAARNGFDEVVGDVRDEAADGLRDSRLMTQIGMLLGFVYLGFLTVWFWATRGRGGLRA